MEHLGQPILTILAQDTKKDKETGHITTISLKNKDGGLLSELKICLGPKAMLTSNISVQDGLVNSATGTVTHFTPTLPPTTSPDFDSFVPKYIWVLFDQEIIGTQRRAQFTNISPDNSTPIELQEVHVKHGPVPATRKQFPLVLAWGTTIHKAQGKTVDQLVIDTTGNFRAGQMYTALSRVKTLDGLYILSGFDKKYLKCDIRSLNEMIRLRR